MKQNRIVRPRRPGNAEKRVNYRAKVWLLAFRSIAVGALVTQSVNPTRAADALPVKELGNQATQAQKPDYSPQGCKMERYKAFARQAEMPAITAPDKTTIEVGGTVKTDLRRLAQLSITEKEALAGQFNVPAAVIDKLVQRVSNGSQPSADQFAQELRTAVVDYRFLQQEWGRYTPPAEGRKVKASALQALQGGDLTKAWELYDGLQKPAPPSPPTNLRIVAQP
jgi:hypothetical protein